MKKLVFNRTEHAEVNLEKPRTTIGRNHNNDVVLDAEGVADFHAEIQLLGDRVHIMDLGSPNGTTVNGSKFSNNNVAEGELAFGDVIQLGNVELVFNEGSAQVRQVVEVDPIQVMGHAGQKIPVWEYGLIGLTIATFGVVYYLFTTHSSVPQPGGENQSAVVAQPAQPNETKGPKPASTAPQ